MTFNMLFIYIVSLDLLSADIKYLAKGMKEATGELVHNTENESLKTFCLEADPRVTKLQEDFETAKVLIQLKYYHKLANSFVATAYL